MIQIQDLCFGYANRPMLFENFSLRIPHGERAALIGPSGCGKTTLLFLLAGLTLPVSGDVMVAGEPLRRPRPRTGLALQDHGLLPWATVEKNVSLGLRIRRWYGPDATHAPSDETLSKAQLARRVDEWLERLDITSLRCHFPAQLSRGQRQRTALARTLALEPDLLLLDEPFSALDPLSSQRLQDAILRLCAEAELTSVLVTHDLEEAVRMASMIVALKAGTNSRPVVVTNPQGVGANPRSAVFRQAVDQLAEILKEGAF